MRVTLLSPRTIEEGQYLEGVIVFAARRCRTTKSHETLWEEVKGYNNQKMSNFLARVVHEEFAIDVLEMAHLVYDLEDVPLWLVVEFLRHRLLFRDLSLEQLSQRAINPLELRVQAPTSELQHEVDAYITRIQHLLAAGRLHPENLREVIPQGVLVNLVMAGNARAWHHFFFMRCSPEQGGKGGAHPKAMELADDALAQARDVFPLIFNRVIPA